MKKGFILLASLFLSTSVALIACLALYISDYNPRLIRDLQASVQASILQDDLVELSKYFLYEARKKGLACIRQIRFSYPNKDDIISLDYVYPLGSCDDFGRLRALYKNISPLKIVMLNSSVSLRTDYGVNEGIFKQKSFFIYPLLLKP